MRGTRAPTKTALQRRRTVLKPEQWPALRREFNEYGPDTQLLIDVAIDTGLRFGELTLMVLVYLPRRMSGVTALYKAPRVPGRARSSCAVKLLTQRPGQTLTISGM